MRHFALLAAASLLASPAFAETKSFEIKIENHKFSPEELKVPANEKFKLVVKNLDKTPEEFESHSLKREKIIKGGTEATINLGPLKPGSYDYFGEFNMDTAKGKIIAE